MDYKQLAMDVLASVGGKENVESVTHCMTRLRFKLKDESLADLKKIDSINGVVKTIQAAGQIQVVIGTTVDKTYAELCKLGNFAMNETVNKEDSDKTKKKFSVKGILNGIMGAIAGSLTPVLPALIGAGLFKMVAVLLGPSNIGILSEDNQIYIFLDLINTAVYYFLPFFVAFTASKRFKCNPVYPMMLAAVMVHPTLLQIVADGKPFNIYGVFPMHLVNYTNGVIPMILCTYFIAFIEHKVTKIVPDMMRVIGIPLLTMAIAYPLCLCIFGPICSIIMSGIANLILWANDTVGILAVVLVGALWFFVVMFGMHVPILMTLLPTWVEMGFDAIVSPATIAASLAMIGTELAYALRANTKYKRETGWSCFVTNVTANIAEPALYGIALVDKFAMAYTMIGGAVGGVFMFIFGAKVTLFSGVGFPFLNFLRFGEYALPGAIGMIIAFAVALALGMIFGFEKKSTEEEN